MCIRSVGCGLLAGLWLIAVGGCQKSSSGEAPPGPDPASAQPKSAALETVARLHWLGKKRLQGETNATFFMSIWDLPESTKLEEQTLDKLALAFADFLSGATNPASATNSSLVGLVRPLFEDLVREESYVEARGGTNQPGEIALAIRLNEDRGDVWRTNFPKIFEKFAATPPQSTARSNSWQLEFDNQKSKVKNRLVLERVGTWTLVSLSRWSVSGGQLPSAGLLSDLASRIQNSKLPFAPAATNFWLEADINLPQAASALACGWDFPAEMPRVSLTMIGDGQNVRTRAELTFSKPVSLELERWNIPTNFVHDPLMSFTAVNGIRPLLAALPAWTNLNISAPNQLYFWGMEGPAVETFFAAPLADASNAVYILSGHFIDVCNPWLAANRMGKLERAVNENGLTWKGFPFLAPFFKSVTLQNNGFVLAGIGPEAAITTPPPVELVREITSQTNLVYYDWEVTGPRILADVYITQLLRLMGHKAQLPENGLGMLWLKALGSHLGNSGTEISLRDPTRISFVRKSGIGLTGIELHLLADWLESPGFPRSLYTLAAPAPPPYGEGIKNSGGSR
jgi:hypothetical protein